MSEDKISQRKYLEALKKLVEGADLLELPAWVIGSKEDPCFTYGVVVGSREFAVGAIEACEDMIISGMLKMVRNEENTLH